MGLAEIKFDLSSANTEGTILTGEEREFRTGKWPYLKIETDCEDSEM